MRHRGIWLACEGRRRFIDFEELTGGRSISIYGQNEVVKDLIAARVETGCPLHYGVEEVSIAALETSPPRVRFRLNGDEHEIECDFIAGCDGSHGVCRPSIPVSRLSIYERDYPFAWLGILAKAPRVRVNSCMRCTSAGSRSSACDRPP